jgi:hypothetical protein
LFLALLPTDHGYPRFQGYTVRNAMQPAGHRFAPPDCARFSSQEQERGLKGVFRILNMTSGSPAHAQHHRTMAMHQGSKRVLFLKCGEAIQEARVCAIGRAATVCKGADAP